MNHESHNKKYAGQTLDWLPMDTEELYKFNLKNRYNELESNGWIDNPVTYDFNSDGFRCDEFSQDPGILFLGCSFTLGIGVHVEQVWPELVSQQLNMQCFNLGQGGASADTAFRFCQGWIDKILPKIIVFALPPDDRIELIVNGRAQDLSPAWSWCDHYSNYLKDWIIDDDNANLNQLKNKLAIKMLCQDRGIKYVEIDPHAISSRMRGHTFPMDFGRDLMHPGPIYHSNVAKIALSLIE
jgi:hypothetical protein